MSSWKADVIYRMCLFTNKKGVSAGVGVESNTYK